MCTEKWLPERYCALKTGYPEKKSTDRSLFSGQPVFSAQYLSGSHFSVHIILPGSQFSVHTILPGSHFSVHYQFQDFQFLLDLKGKNISDQDKNYVSELSKMSPFIYKKLADHDRIPLRKPSSRREREGGKVGSLPKYFFLLKSLAYLGHCP